MTKITARSQIATATRCVLSRVNASTCEVRTAPATVADALRAFDRGAKVTKRDGCLVVTGRACWYTVS